MNTTPSENFTQKFSEPTAVPVLLISVCIIATCGILYELLISTISSYLMGSSVLHFSLTIGLFLSFMGIGAFFSKYFEEKFLLDNFIMIEIWLGLTGGASGMLLYATYAFTENYYLISFLLTGAIGVLVGLEIPILTRIVKNYFSLKDTLAQVLTFDYLGALIASLLFPLFLLPYLGLMRTSFFIGLLNLSVGLFNLLLFRKQVFHYYFKLFFAILIFVVYGLGFAFAYGINAFLEQFLYEDEVILAKQTAYQNLVLTRWNQDVRLYINNNLQFSSLDEYRYHEALVHIPLGLVIKPRKVLLLGAGDGLAAREILKNPEVESIEIVDLDPEMTRLAKENFTFRRLNENALNQPKVKVRNEDAFKFIEKSKELYSLIIIDLPDPSDVHISKMYTKEFYKIVKKCLARDGAMVTQSSSPFFAREVFWCIFHTMQEVFPSVIPYTVNVPSFGQWGFNLALNVSLSASELQAPHLAKKVAEKLEKQKLFPYFKYLTSSNLLTLFNFDADMAEINTEINTLSTQKLVQYHEKNWEEFN